MRLAASFARRDAGSRLSSQISRRVVRKPHGPLLPGHRREGYRSWHSPLRKIPCVVGGGHAGQSRGIVTHATVTSHQEPTIYALSSAPGRAAIAVIRLSGSACKDVYHAICPRKPMPKPRSVVVRTLYEPWETPRPETILDSSALLLYFPAPATATGEDILELHVHGGPAIVKAVLSAVSKCGRGAPGTIRYAEPGEFTRRAFMNNRMDLTQVEALGDTLAADTEQQRRLSLRGTTGALAKSYEAWRQQLLYARGELEALIDFSEDQHFDESPVELCASVAQQVQRLRSALQIHSRNAVRGELLRHGITVSLLGAPNAGKSSLLNRIVGREAAIVSHEAGTTRDVVEIGLDLGGYFCRFGDTAGLRPARGNPSSHDDARGTTDGNISRIEQEGMLRAKARAADSDVVVIVLSFESSQGTNNRAELHLDPEVCSLARRLIQEKDNVTIVINKADLLTASPPTSSSDHPGSPDPHAGILASVARQVQETFPGLSRRRVHVVSCAAAAAADGSGTSGANSKSPRSAPATSSPQTPPLERDERPDDDPGRIQRFLHDGLIRHFAELTAALTGGGGEAGDPSVWRESLGASERHRVLLDACVGHLDAFLAEAQGAVSPELGGGGGDDGGGPGDADGADLVVAAEHLRAAAECLARITGRGAAGDVEEVLGVVFEKFCVGK